MDNASSSSSPNGPASLLQGPGLAQQQRLYDATCLVQKTPASPEMRLILGSPVKDDDLAYQQHKASFKLAHLCGTSPQKHSSPGSPASYKDEDSKASFLSNNTAALASSCSLDDAGQLDVSSSQSPPAEHSCRLLDSENLSNNQTRQQSPAAVAAAQQTLEHAQAAGDCVVCPRDVAHVQADAGSGVSQQGLPVPLTDEEDACCVFFARVPPTVPYESILALFQQFGAVKSLNLFRPWASAKTSKGCGVVEYEAAPAALAAMQALHTKYHWTGGDTTMVVEWMDPARHRKDKQASEDDGKASCNNSGTPKASKSARRRSNGKNPCRPAGNFSSMSMSMPNMGLGGRLMPLVAGLASNMCGMPYAATQQYSAPWVMGMAAGDMTLRQAAPLAGMTGGLVDPAAAAGLGCSAMPLLHAHGLEQGANLLPVMYGATSSSRSHDGSSNSWPVNHVSEPMPVITHAAAQAAAAAAAAAAADRAALANLLLQQQRQAAIASIPATGAVQQYNSISADGSIAAYRAAHTASQPDLQQMIDNLNTQNYLAGLVNMDAGLGSVTGSPALHALSVGSTAASYTTLQNAARTGSPAASSCNLLFDNCQYSTPSMAAAAAAANMAAAGSTSSSVAGGYGCVNAPLPRIATHSSDGCASGVFSLCGQDLSPVTATSNTPTYFQQAYTGTVSASSHSLLGMNAAGVAPVAYGSTHFMCSESGVAPAAAALQDQFASAAAVGMMAAAQRAASQSRLATAVRRNSSGMAPYMMPTDLRSHGSMGSLLAGDNRWGSM